MAPSNDRRRCALRCGSTARVAHHEARGPRRGVVVYAYTISQPCCRSTSGRPASSRSMSVAPRAAGAPCEPRRETVDRNRDAQHGLRQRAPVAVVDDGSFGRSTRTPAASRRMRATIWPSGVATSKSSVAAVVPPVRSARRPVVAASRGQSSVARRTRARHAPRPDGIGGGAVAHAARAATPATASAWRSTAIEVLRRPSRRTVSSSTALSGVTLSCDCHTSCARSRSPFAHSTSPEMRRDLGVGALLQRAAEVRLGFGVAPELEQRPSHAVEDERIVGRKLVRALDERESLGDARRAVDDGVSQRVERLRVVGLQLDHAAQARLGVVDRGPGARRPWRRRRGAPANRDAP